jgi:hypothetical protein
MPVAAVTPRVRTIVICDDVAASEIEHGVFTLEGVRHQLVAESFPLRSALNRYLLSSARKGRYSGTVLLVNEGTDRVVRQLEFVARFDHDNVLLPMYLELGRCVFPEAGAYRFEIYFSARGHEVLKGEYPFHVLSSEE